MISSISSVAAGHVGSERTPAAKDSDNAIAFFRSMMGTLLEYYGSSNQALNITGKRDASRVPSFKRDSSLPRAKGTGGTRHDRRAKDKEVNEWRRSLKHLKATDYQEEIFNP
jgi:hypothetical protein